MGEDGETINLEDGETLNLDKSSLKKSHTANGSVVRGAKKHKHNYAANGSVVVPGAKKHKNVVEVWKEYLDPNTLRNYYVNKGPKIR